MKKITKSKSLIPFLLLGAAIGVLRGGSITVPPSITYYIISLLTLIALIAFACLSGTAPAPKAHKKSDVFKTAIVISAFGTAIAGFFSFNIPAALAAEPIDTLPMLCVAFALIAAVGIFLSVGSKDGETSSIAISLPVFYGGALLLYFYKEYTAANPHMYNYAMEIIAAALTALAVYSVGIMKFSGKAKSPLVTFCVLGSVSSVTALTVGSLISGGVISLPLLGALIFLSLYSVAWYLDPPDAYIIKKAEPDENKTDRASDDPSELPHFFDMETAEPMIPDVDAIIDEVKSQMGEPLPDIDDLNSEENPD